MMSDYHHFTVRYLSLKITLQFTRTGRRKGKARQRGWASRRGTLRWFKFYHFTSDTKERATDNETKYSKPLQSPVSAFPSTCSCAFFVLFAPHTNIKIISNIPSITTATICLVSSPRAFFSIVPIDFEHVEWNASHFHIKICASCLTRDSKARTEKQMNQKWINLLKLI